MNINKISKDYQDLASNNASKRSHAITSLIEQKIDSDIETLTADINAKFSAIDNQINIVRWAIGIGFVALSVLINLAKFLPFG